MGFPNPSFHRGTEKIRGTMVKRVGSHRCFEQKNGDLLLFHGISWLINGYIPFSPSMVNNG